MYNRLQARYPGSSLLSEYLGCAQQLFLVRVVLSWEGEPLAAALAGAETIEQAEERARDRLAVLLGLAPEAPARDSSSPARPRPRPAASRPPAAEPADAADERARPEAEPDEPPAAASPAPGAIADVDEFIRINAETQRHLKRLGWDGDRVRRHLLQTYQRPSRQQLRDDELREFLNYLKAQPG